MAKPQDARKELKQLVGRVKKQQLKMTGYLELTHHAVHRINTTVSVLFGYIHKPKENPRMGIGCKQQLGTTQSFSFPPA